MKKQNTVKSLWPKVESMAEDTPIRILKEQADLFNAQMKGLLRCTLERQKKSESVYNRSYDYIASLNITIPALLDFRQELVRVKYLVVEAYPCEVINCIEERYHNTTQKAQNVKDYMNILKSVLNSRKVINALQNMLAQDI